MSDSRTGKRFPLQLPIRIQKKSGKQLDGKTSNLSAAGVYIKADADFEIGSRVDFEITLPASIIGAARDVEIHCRGRVIRTDPGSKGQEPQAGVACVIDRYKFIRGT